MEKEKDLVLLCRQLIEHSLNWGSSDQWNNQDFENLSEKIFEKTQVRLSVSTLKRIWGKVRYDSSPTMATLNALAHYLDLENWREFQHKHSNQKKEEDVPEGRPAVHDKSKKRRVVQVLSSAALLIAVIALAFLLIKGKTPTDHKSANVLFKSHLVTDDLPNSVVFDYDASSFHSDSVFIQQSWDPEKRKKVSSTGKQHTSIYYYPGYFLAKLVVDGEIKKEDVVFIKTKGWKGIINRQHDPFYLHEKEIKLEGSLGVTSATLKEKLVSTVFNNVEVSFSNVRDFDGVNGSNFYLETSLKNTSTVEESLCRRTSITLLSKGGAIIIPLITKGCISEIGVLTGNGFTSGKEHDLSAFGCDFNDFEKLVCRVADQKLAIYLNDKLIFSEEQKNPVGDIIGIRIAFEGAGEIKDVKLSALDKVVYEEHF